MKVKVIHDYDDLQLHKFMREGDKFECDENRAELLVSKGFVEVIKVAKKNTTKED